MLFDDPVQLGHLPLGLGSVVVDGASVACQYSEFALPQLVRSAKLVLADPKLHSFRVQQELTMLQDRARLLAGEFLWELMPIKKI